MQRLEILSREKFYLKPGSNIKTLKSFSRCSQNFFIPLVPVPYTGGSTWRLQTTNKFRLIACPSFPRRAAQDPQFFSLGHVLWLPSDVQRAQSCYRADKFVVPCAHLDHAHLSILTKEHFFHSTQMPPTAWSVLFNNEHYIPNFQVVFRLSPFLSSVKC